MRLYILCEGQCEEQFIKTFLAKYFINIDFVPIIVKTKKTPLKSYKGGLTSYFKLINEIKNIVIEHRNEYVTTFFDLYGLKDIPDKISSINDKYDLVKALEDYLASLINYKYFFPYISLHEFEALLFVKPEIFDLYKNGVSNKVKEILKKFNDNPELINNSKETAPSKRINLLIGGYQKLADSQFIYSKLSLEDMILKCKHFSSWIEIISSLNYNNNNSEL